MSWRVIVGAASKAAAVRPAMKQKTGDGIGSRESKLQLRRKGRWVYGGFWVRPGGGIQPSDFVLGLMARSHEASPLDDLSGGQGR